MAERTVPIVQQKTRRHGRGVNLRKAGTGPFPGSIGHHVARTDRAKIRRMQIAVKACMSMLQTTYPGQGQ